MLRVCVATSVMMLSACGESVTNTDTQIDLAAQQSWSIAADGDLNAFFECVEAEGAALVSAHRGGPAPGYPENAIETMAAVLAEAPALMEIDVATSADGVLYLMHDDTLERTTTGAGETNALAWNDIKKLALEDNDGAETKYAPSRFDDALRWADGRTILQIDFKRTTRYEDVVDEINRQDAEDRVILIAYSMASAEKLHRLLPDAMISLSLNSQSELNRAVAAGVPTDRILGFTGIEDPRPRLFSILNSRNVEVIFGTLGGRDSIDNDIARSGYEALYAEIAAQGADIIATDRPREAHAALAEAGRAVEEPANAALNAKVMLDLASGLARMAPMKRIVALYALALAAAVFLLQWLEYKYVTKVFAGEFYILLIAAGFTALGAWSAWRLTQKNSSSGFEKNDAALRSLGVTAREYETLELLAAGLSNKEIARKLEVSPNTVKTHLAKLYEKLEVSRRTQAIQKAKDLALIP